MFLARKHYLLIPSCGVEIKKVLALWGLKGLCGIHNTLMSKTGIIITLLLCMSFEEDILIQGHHLVLEFAIFEILMH